ncbi:metallophosphoesterase family protein [Massilibacteroides sp.]|uniref:metallophosphoesterase family protein n=1 Tax=Massilibacteroides sp. TaxID=2034766 RepID=UPI00262EC4ED|nr:metallophosphoesterase family protein [Massilibacteroides sp.]MDD4514013.1 metallophosphoesterase family protein [Massilibacteroides sp.]
MKQKFSLLFSLLLVASMGVSVFAQKTQLKFNGNKKFKVVQFTDLHVKYQDPNSAIAFERIDQVIKDEKPDMIILTGDIIYSKPAVENLRSVLKAVASHDIPFSILFGNHDDEFEVSREELIKISDEFPNSLTADEPNLSGVGNYILKVKGSSGSKDEAVLYCLDSHAYSTIEGVKGYGFFNFDQINWYLKQSAEFTKNNNGTPLPALAFFHIPLPEYAQAASDEAAQLYGIRREKSCPPQLNTGMFTAMKQSGDVMGTFVGHDHNNDYAVNWHGIILAYGRYSGGDTVYNDLPNGARVIELTEGERGFRTWIRTAAGVTQETTFPKDYIKK